MRIVPAKTGDNDAGGSDARCRVDDIGAINHFCNFGHDLVHKQHSNLAGLGKQRDEI